MAIGLASGFLEPLDRTIAAADAKVEVVSSGGGHYSLHVRSPAFRDRSTLERHRMVYTAIAPLMAGDTAPVHAIDTLKTAVD